MSGVRAKPRDVRVVVLSQFVTAFSWTYVFLPFYIQQISPYDREATLLWIGWILGITGAASTVFAPIWGGMAAKVSPKRLYQAGMLLQAVFMGLMGFTESLPVLLLLRLLIGCIGGLSTIGLIIVSASSASEKLTGNVGLFQAALTSGQIAGPIAGALSAELIGFRATFVVGAVLILIAFANVRLYLSPLPTFRPEMSPRPTSPRGLAAGWLLCFAATIQIVFLPSVLPEILASLRVAQAQAVATAGLIVFAYGVTAMIGSYALSQLAGHHGRRRTILWAAVSASALQLLLSATGSVITFGLIRARQVGPIAGVIPIVFAEVAGTAHGSAIGFINPARFAANAVGPLIATVAFAHASPFSLYLSLSAFTLLALVLFLRAPAASAALAPPP
ncbi:MAG: MFS transporter [Candidatus Methylomirabilis sp.]